MQRQTGVPRQIRVPVVTALHHPRRHPLRRRGGTLALREIVRLVRQHREDQFLAQVAEGEHMIDRSRDMRRSRRRRTAALASVPPACVDKGESGVGIGDHAGRSWGGSPHPDTRTSERSPCARASARRRQTRGSDQRATIDDRSIRCSRRRAVPSPRRQRGRSCPPPAARSPCRAKVATIAAQQPCKAWARAPRLVSPTVSREVHLPPRPREGPLPLFMAAQRGGKQP